MFVQRGGSNVCSFRVSGRSWDHDDARFLFSGERIAVILGSKVSIESFTATWLQMDVWIKPEALHELRSHISETSEDELALWHRSAQIAFCSRARRPLLENVTSALRIDAGGRLLDVLGCEKHT